MEFALKLKQNLDEELSRITNATLSTIVEHCKDRGFGGFIINTYGAHYRSDVLGWIDFSQKVVNKKYQHLFYDMLDEIKVIYDVSAKRWPCSSTTFLFPKISLFEYDTIALRVEFYN
jgi:hypothetical protein